jgi:hypothetical protein
MSGELYQRRAVTSHDSDLTACATVAERVSSQYSAVGHYWIVDPVEETLAVYRFTEGGYLVALKAERGERVRAEPFDAIELPVGIFFGDEPD